MSITANITDLRRGTVSATRYLHATGGLRGSWTTDGWFFGPLHHHGSFRSMGPVPDQAVGAACKAMSARVFGADEVSEPGTLLPSRIWTPFVGAASGAPQPADVWGWVAHAAQEANDTNYATLARNVAACMRAAGIRLRDASDEYHRQLIAALDRQQPADRRFSNVAMADLHLACHSLLSEMGSARDYMAAIVAMTLGAPAKIDAASRLVSWLEKPVNAAVASDPQAQMIVHACNENGPDGWLYDLGEYRNQFLHREPLSVSESGKFLKVVEQHSTYGRIVLLQMQIPVRPAGTDLCDALERFVDLHSRLCLMATTIANQAKYPPQIPHFVHVPNEQKGAAKSG